jgi:hypothetical protein
MQPRRFVHVEILSTVYSRDLQAEVRLGMKGAIQGSDEAVISKRRVKYVPWKKTRRMKRSCGERAELVM